jgi:hypothetical protein
MHWSGANSRIRRFSLAPYVSGPVCRTPTCGSHRRTHLWLAPPYPPVARTLNGPLSPAVCPVLNSPVPNLLLVCSATSDPGALNRAEYIKYIATFFNK